MRVGETTSTRGPAARGGVESFELSNRVERASTSRVWYRVVTGIDTVIMKANVLLVCTYLHIIFKSRYNYL